LYIIDEPDASYIPTFKQITDVKYESNHILMSSHSTTLIKIYKRQSKVFDFNKKGELDIEIPKKDQKS
jgi:hypothetical protein